MNRNPGEDYCRSSALKPGISLTDDGDWPTKLQYKNKILNLPLCFSEKMFAEKDFTKGISTILVMRNQGFVENQLPGHKQREAFY